MNIGIKNNSFGSSILQTHEYNHECKTTLRAKSKSLIQNLIAWLIIDSYTLRKGNNRINKFKESHILVNV